MASLPPQNWLMAQAEHPAHSQIHPPHSQIHPEHSQINRLGSDEKVGHNLSTLYIALQGTRQESLQQVKLGKT